VRRCALQLLAESSDRRTMPHHSRCPPRSAAHSTALRTKRRIRIRHNLLAAAGEGAILAGQAEPHRECSMAVSGDSVAWCREQAFRPSGGDFQGIGVYRSDGCFWRAQRHAPPRSGHRLDEPARLSLGNGCIPAVPASVSPGEIIVLRLGANRRSAPRPRCSSAAVWVCRAGEENCEHRGSGPSQNPICAIELLIPLLT
jgi:hypothetical protein